MEWLPKTLGDWGSIASITSFFMALWALLKVNNLERHLGIKMSVVSLFSISSPVDMRANQVGDSHNTTNGPDNNDNITYSHKP
jgi:hypothetical protein